MYTGIDLYHKYGDPASEKHMILWDVPTELEVGCVPRKIYCHQALAGPLRAAILNMITRGYIDELKTWDGCFNIRPIRGYEDEFKQLTFHDQIEQSMRYLSIHSWGLAIDVNAAWNKLGVVPTLSAGFVRCFTDAGFEWGGHWARKDGMHFQLARI